MNISPEAILQALETRYSIPFEQTFSEMDSMIDAAYIKAKTSLEKRRSKHADQA